MTVLHAFCLKEKKWLRLKTWEIWSVNLRQERKFAILRLKHILNL